MKAKSLLSFVLISAIVLTGCASSPVTATSAPQRTITISAEGRADGIPDIATVNLGVNTRDASASIAMAANNAKSATLVAAIKNAGIDPKDIQTNNFSIYFQPTYDANGQPTGTGVYVVDNSMTVTVRDITKLGKLLDDAFQAGANNINGISFSVSDTTALESQARAKAFAAVKALADEYAKGLGLSIGKIVSVSEGAPYTVFPVAKTFAADGMGAGSVPVQSGTYTVTVSVTVTYEIQ